MCRDSGIPASIRLGLSDVIGTNIDLAVSERLAEWDLTRDQAQAHRLAAVLAKGMQDAI